MSAKSILAALGGVDAARAPVRRMPSSVIGYASSESSVTSLRPFRGDGRVLKSELDGIANEAWTNFVFAMKVAALDAISPSNGFGMFDMRCKRLADLKLVTNLRYKRDPITNRSVQTADWVPPITQEQFLKSASVQYKVFVASVRKHLAGLRSGEIAMPDGAMPAMTVSGALAILHRGGPSALKKWNTEKFESTLEIFNHANGCF